MTRLALLLWVASVIGSPLLAGRDGLLRLPPEAWQDGTARGVAIVADGSVRAAREQVRLAGASLDAIQILALAADAVGNLYLGTGPAGVVYRVSASGETTELFRSDDPWVTALQVDAGGELYAATAPSGRIYRINRAGVSSVWSKVAARYIWAMEVGADDQLVAVTGQPAMFLSFNDDGDYRTMFSSQDGHFVSLSRDRDEGWLVGSSDRGRLYRLDAEGHPLVLHEDSLEEITGAVRGPDGFLWVIAMSGPSADLTGPTIELQLPPGPHAGLEQTSQNVLRGRLVQSGTTEPIDPALASEPIIGRLLRIDERGQSRVIWSSTKETPFAVSIDGTGRPIFCTGSPATLYAVEEGQRIVRLTGFEQAQATRLLVLGRVSFLATSHGAGLYRLDPERVQAGSYLSPILDAGGMARWGTLRWTAADSGLPAELYARSGNAVDPDESWSAWSPRLADSQRSELDLPDGRYLQWRVRFPGGRLGTQSVSGVAASYQRYNEPPSPGSLERDAGDGNRVRWTARDPNGDRLRLRLSALTADGTWRPLPQATPDGLSGGGLAEQHGLLTLAEGALGEGVHQVQGFVSDEASNPPGEGLETAFPRSLRWTVDPTPPRIDVTPGDTGRFDITVTDSLSTIRQLELWNGNRLEYRLRPVDGVYDDRVEHFVLHLPEGTEGATLRGEDAAGNEVRFELSVSMD